MSKRFAIKEIKYPANCLKDVEVSIGHDKDTVLFRINDTEFLLPDEIYRDMLKYMFFMIGEADKIYKKDA